VRPRGIATVLSVAAILIAVHAAIAIADGGGTGTGGVSARHSADVVLRRGDRGPAVKLVQRKLHLRADGVFGASTVRAVKRFQRRKRLTPDGAVGTATRRALRLRPFSRASVYRRSARLPRVLRLIAECESSGDPTAVSKDGRYRGKYQFTRSTWKSLGGRGDPAEALESQQDGLALKLYRSEGVEPWGACGRAAKREA
jgi:transglycosylase-like protein/putative peptidoglycan binding protein